MCVWVGSCLRLGKSGAEQRAGLEWDVAAALHRCLFLEEGGGGIEVGLCGG